MNKPKKKPALKLYVWDEFEPNYTCGLAFAIASSEGEARKLVLDECYLAPRSWGEVKVFPLNNHIAFKCYGGS